MDIIFLFLPVFLWVFIFGLIVSVSRSGRSGGRNRSRQNTQVKRQTRQFSRPKVQDGLFDMKVGQKGKNASGQSAAKGRSKDFVSGYDKKYALDERSRNRAAARQYSHTYDGHEPWDKCLPKEKDPWDKDFYA